MNFSFKLYYLFTLSKFSIKFTFVLIVRKTFLQSSYIVFF